MNNKILLDEVISFLDKNDIKTWIFGGWAEELLSIIERRSHHDVDLLYPAKDFALVDTLFASDKKLQEIKAKHFPHKRAFIYKDVMVEIFLLQSEKGIHFTNFWNEKLYQWPDDTLTDSNQQNRIVSKLALSTYRKNHHKLIK